MMRQSTTIFLSLLLAGCGGEGAETRDAQADQGRGPLTAIFSCQIGEAEFPASACVVGHQSTAGVGGSLKISNGGEVQDYSEPEILDALAASRSPITLHEPFSIQAQAGGDTNLVLRLEVQESGQIIFQDEARQYGVIHVDSDDLPDEPIAGVGQPSTAQAIKELNEAVDEMNRVNRR